MKILLALAAVAILAACGGGSDALDPTELSRKRPPRQSVEAPSVKIVHYGDSTTSGYQLTNGSSPSAEAQKILNRWGHSFELVNEGVRGSTALSLLHGNDYIHLDVPFSTFMPQAAPAIIELRYHGANEMRTGQTQEQLKQSLQSLVSTARANTVPVILTTPNPPDPAIIGPHRVEWAKQSAHTIRNVFLANRDVAVLCDIYRLATEAGIITQKTDGLHSNEQATVFEGRRLANCVMRANDLRMGEAP